MLTTYFKKQLMDAISGQISGSSAVSTGYYFGLSTTTPTVGTTTGTAADCNFTEPSSADNYARVCYNKGATSILVRYPFNYPTGTTTYNQVENTTEIHFNVATQSWGTITHIGFFDNNNHLLAFTELNNSIVVTQGSIATILVGDAVITLEAE